MAQCQLHDKIHAADIMMVRAKQLKPVLGFVSTMHTVQITISEGIR